MNLLTRSEAGGWVYQSPSRGQGIDKGSKLFLSGEPLSYGSFRCKTPLEDAWVRLEADCETKGLLSPETAVTVMLSFFTVDGHPIRRQYISPVNGDSLGSLHFCRVFEVPENTAYGIVELSLRWPQGGHVVFNQPMLSECDPPPERTARVLVTHFHCNGSSIPWFDRITTLFGKIGPCKPDLVCLSELLHAHDRLANPREAAEPIDGPFIRLLSQLATKHNTYVIGNFLEADGSGLFNTSALIDRKGGLTGIYRKTHLPLSEIEFGTSPGETYPVFETDFACLGLITCWDAAFPEPMGILRQKGAELVVCSSLGDFWPQDMVRAHDNGLWLAVAGAHRQPNVPYPPSRIYNPVGTAIAACGDDNADVFVFSDIDFNRCFYKHWASVGPCEGEPPSLYRIERRPETY